MTMMTKEQIRNLLLHNRNWEPKDTDPDALWDLYDEVYQEMEESGELGAKMQENKKKDPTMSEGPDSFDTDDDEDDDDPYEYDEEEY